MPYAVKDLNKTIWIYNLKSIQLFRSNISSYKIIIQVILVSLIN